MGDYSDVVFPVAAKVVMDYLNPRLTVPVYHTVPRTPPGAYVRVSRSGGMMYNAVTDAPLITISVYHHDAYEAAVLAGRVRALMLGVRGKKVGDVWVRWWSDGAPVEYPDPDVGLTRFQFTGELRLKIN